MEKEFVKKMSIPDVRYLKGLLERQIEILKIEIPLTKERIKIEKEIAKVKEKYI